jgi:hypothetical protein
MRIDNLSELPEWDDHEFEDEDAKAESWKPNPTKLACKAMYQQWNTVLVLLKAAFDSLKTPHEDAIFGPDYWDHHKDIIISDAYEIGAKIKSSEAGLYILRMENAAIIRKNAQFIYTSMHSFVEEEIMEDMHRQIIRDEIDKFRALFKAWVATFEKDDYEDEWGLFT